MTSILVVDDEHRFSSAMAEFLRALGHVVATSDNIASAREFLSANRIDVLIVDLMLPDGNGLELLEEQSPKTPRRTIVMTGHRSMKSMIRQLHGPDLHYLIKPLDMEAVASLCDLGETDDAVEPHRHYGALIGDSQAMQLVYEKIEQVARTNTTVVVMGESGTGKELIAEAIHTTSGREGPIVPINCGALSTELIASELFGHEKGSFTGAQSRHLGAFERATEGTLFLDEITEMPVDQQPHLLRALESLEVRRVGGNNTISVNTRIVAATNRPLRSAVAEGRLREDLFYRLSIFPIEVPPLRTRREDIPALVTAFLADFNRQYGRHLSVSPQHMDRFSAWNWPGNVRELRHAVHRCIIATPMEISALSVPDSFAGAVALKPVKQHGAASLSERPLKEIEREVISSALKHFNGNRKATAESLGISPKTLYNRMQEYQEDDEGNAIEPL